MKTEELDALISRMDMGDLLVDRDNITLSIDGKGDLKNTFPVPACDRCVKKCCPPRVMISLYDVARFMDDGMEDYVAGQFRGYVKLFLSEEGEDVDLSRPHMFPTDPDAKDCVFLDKDKKCSIYERRPYICRSYPVVIRIDKDRNRFALWLGGCKDFDISTDKEAFDRLLDSAIHDYNEKIKSNVLLLNRRSELRELGFGKYLEDELSILTDYKNENQEMRAQIQDMEKTLERLKQSREHGESIQRLHDDNDWLKERVVNLEKELSEQRQKAHLIITELTAQLSEQRKLMEHIREGTEGKKKGLWR